MLFADKDVSEFERKIVRYEVTQNVMKCYFRKYRDLICEQFFTFKGFVCAWWKRRQEELFSFTIDIHVNDGTTRLSRL